MDGLFQPDEFITFKDKDGRILIDGAMELHLNKKLTKKDSSGKFKIKKKTIVREDSSLGRFRKFLRFKGYGNHLDLINLEMVREFVKWLAEFLGAKDHPGIFRDLSSLGEWFRDITKINNNIFYKVRQEISDKMPEAMYKRDK